MRDKASSLLSLLVGFCLLASISCSGGKPSTPEPLTTATIPEARLSDLLTSVLAPLQAQGFTVRLPPQTPGGCPQATTPPPCVPSAPRLFAAYGDDKGTVVSVQVVAGIDSREAKSEYTKLIDSYSTIAVGTLKKVRAGNGASAFSGGSPCKPKAAPTSDDGCIWKKIAPVKVGDEALEFEQQSSDPVSQRTLVFRRGSVAANVYVSTPLLNALTPSPQQPAQDAAAWQILDTTAHRLDTQIQQALR